MTPVKVRPPVGVVLLRALRVRCPACGRGKVFLRGLESERRCGVCSWRLERGPGHWVGGSEINMLVTFPAGGVVVGAAVLIGGMGPVSVVAVAAATVAVSLLFYRRSRSLFLALDYLVDPTPDPATGTGGETLLRDGDPPPSPAPAPAARRGSCQRPVAPGRCRPRDTRHVAPVGRAES